MTCEQDPGRGPEYFDTSAAAGFGSVSGDQRFASEPEEPSDVELDDDEPTEPLKGPDQPLSGADV